MRKVLRKVCTIALAMLGAASVNAADIITDVIVANFDDGTTPFGGWGSYSVSVVDGELVIDHQSVEEYNYSTQMAKDMAFEYDTKYYMEFRIKGTAEGTLSAGFQVMDGYKSAGEFPDIPITTEWTDVKVSTTVTLEGCDRFLFSYGFYAGTIYMDDFRMYTKKEGSFSNEIDPSVAQAARWVNVLTNSDLEGEDNISFVSVENDPEKVDETGAFIRGNAPIVEGIGVDGSRGISVKAFAPRTNTWDAQFWIEVPEYLPAGTKYRVKFDYCASADISAETQAHALPSDYIHYEMLGNPAFTLDWQTFDKEGVLSSSQSTADKQFKSIAFNLAISETDNVEYFFDNLYFYLYEPVTVALYAEEMVMFDFDSKNNIADLVAAGGKPRLIFPNECVTVKRDGEEVPVYSVEAFADGRMYIFVDDFLEEGQAIEVTYNNPEDPAYQIKFTDEEGAAFQFEGQAHWNQTIAVKDALPNDLAPATIVSSKPENNAFNLPATITDFEVAFDKAVNLGVLKAELRQEGVTIEALNVAGTGEGDYAEAVVLTRTGRSLLVEGAYTIYIENIANESIIESEGFWGDASLDINIGQDPASFEQFEVYTDFLNYLNTARSSMNAAADPIYEGSAYTAVSEAVAKYEAEYPAYTGPSEFKAASNVLKVTANDMNKHKELCDTYYNTVNGAVDALANYSASKFAGLSLYIDLNAAVANYLNEDGTAVKLIEDEALQAAIDAMKPAVDAASMLFTEGVSQVGNTGVKVLVERIRLGAEALLSLGVSETDELILAANNALEDDDNLADMIKINLKKQLYNVLQNPDNTLFEGVMDETTLETIPAKYDMTVFVKNPNIYRQTGVIPGWSAPEGYNMPDRTSGWSEVNYDIVDNMFQTWGAAYCVEQTIEDLPAGVYTIAFGFGERDNEPGIESFVYAKTSETLEGEYADSTKLQGMIGQTFPYAENGGEVIEGIVVTDGRLTIGVNACQESHTFFNDVRLYINGAAPGFDYAAAYQEVVIGIDLNAAPVQVKGIELYDLNGRRLSKTQKGVVIVKKYMSDGTIRVEKSLK